MRTRGSLFALQMVFGASHSVLCMFLKYSIRLLFRVLKGEEDVRVFYPQLKKLQSTRRWLQLIILPFKELGVPWMD
jgi:hypothetical protein